MPVIKCQVGDESGHQWGKEGKCFIGEDSEEKAQEVGRAEREEVKKQGALVTTVKKLLELVTQDTKDTRPIFKSLDVEKRLITGVVLEPGIFDGHKDIYDHQTVEDTALEFMELYQTIGKQHSEKADAVPVESFIARDDMFIGDELVLKGTWVMTVKVNDDQLWEDAKDGKFTGFSIGGYSEVEDL